MNDEVKLILTKLRIVRDSEENGCYICDREHSKLLLSYIEQLQEDNEHLKRLCETQNNREYRSKFLKEFQKEHGKNVYPDYDEIYKRYDEMKAELQEANDSVTWWQNRFNSLTNIINKTYKELCDMRIGDMSKEELFDFAVGLLDEIWNYDKRIDKALKIIDIYELGKYDYSTPPGGIIELREALKGDSDYE